MKVLVLGAGKMVEAILCGLSTEMDLKAWYLFSPSGQSAELLSKKVGATWLKDLNTLHSVDLVLIGAKPQQITSIKDVLNGRFKEALFVSMMAAIDERKQREILGTHRLIRIMPNLAVKFKEGVTLLSSQSCADEILKIEDLFKKIGHCETVKEEELEELTLLTGSGPALFYEFSHKLAQCFHSLSDEKREALVRSVLVGAGKSVQAEDQSLSGMIDAVTSKGGVTIEILKEWRRLGLDQTLLSGVEAGLERSKEIKGLTPQN
jgi:pyrroline-5-carboxylate reductase